MITIITKKMTRGVRMARHGGSYVSKPVSERHTTHTAHLNSWDELEIFLGDVKEVLWDGEKFYEGKRAMIVSDVKDGVVRCSVSVPHSKFAKTILHLEISFRYGDRKIIIKPETFKRA